MEGVDEEKIFEVKESKSKSYIKTLIPQIIAGIIASAIFTLLFWVGRKLWINFIS